jgi:hypothetical protein
MVWSTFKAIIIDDNKNTAIFELAEQEAVVAIKNINVFFNRLLSVLFLKTPNIMMKSKKRYNHGKHDIIHVMVSTTISSSISHILLVLISSIIDFWPDCNKILAQHYYHGTI